MTRQLSPLLPREMNVSLCYSTQETVAGSGVVHLTRFGLFEPLNKVPLYMPELFNIYRYARITAVRVQQEVVNTGVPPLKMVQAVAPWNDTVAIGSLSQKPTSIIKSVGAATGMSRGVISKTWYSQEELGNPVFDKEHWFTLVQATSTTPQDQSAPAVFTAVYSLSSSIWSAELYWKVSYSLQFFDMEIAPTL